MSRIVWDQEHGWHDGSEAVVGLDEKGRLTITPVDRARELGTEHGTEAAESWLGKYGPHSIGRIQATDFLNGRTRQPSHWPRHDSVNRAPECVLTWGVGSPQMDAYEAGFTAAVEATIRCETGGRDAR